MANYLVSYYPAVLLLFAATSCGISIFVAPFLLSTKTELTKLSKDLKTVIPNLGTAFASLLLPLWLWFICKKNTWECTGQVRYQVTDIRSVVEGDTSLSDEDHEGSPLLVTRGPKMRTSFIPVIVFGLGSILCAIFDMVLDYEPMHVLEFSTVFFYICDLSYLIFLVIQIKFFIMYDGAILKNSAVYHFSIAVMIVCQILLWITSALIPFFRLSSNSMDVSSDKCLNGSNMTDSTEIHNNSTDSIPDYVKYIYYMLEPFSVEYLTITTGYLFHLWQNLDRRSDVTSNNNISTPRHLSPENNIQGRINRATYGLSRKTRNVLFGLITVIAISYFIVVICESGELIECKHRICYYAYIGTVAVAYSPQFLCLVLVVRMHKTYRPVQESLSTNDIILLFTSGCKYVLFTLQFIALIGIALQTSYIDANGISVYVKLMYPILSVAQFSLQTHFLISVSSLHRSGQELSSLIQLMTFYIGTMQIAQWWLIAIQRAAFKETFTLWCEFYLSFGPNTTQIILLTLFPVTGFYSFHSAMVALEIVGEAVSQTVP